MTKITKNAIQCDYTDLAEYDEGEENVSDVH